MVICWVPSDSSGYLCRMISHGMAKPALIGLVLAGGSDWVSVLISSWVSLWVT